MKEKVPGKVELWECYTGPTRLQPTVDTNRLCPHLPTCFCRDSREDFNHTLIYVIV